MRNQKDIEKDLKQFPKQHLSDQSKEDIHNAVTQSDFRASRAQKKHPKRFQRVAAWTASIAAAVLFAFLGSLYMMDENPMVNTPAQQKYGMGDSEKSMPNFDFEDEDQPDQATEEPEEKGQNQDDTDKASDSSQQNKDQAETGTDDKDKSEKPAADKGEQPDLIAKSNNLIDALYNRNMEIVAEAVHPQKGLLFSPYVNILDDAVVVDKENVAGLLQSDEQKVWGNYDGKGTPIKLTPTQYFDEFVDAAPFVKNPDDILVDEMKRRGNTKNNIKEVFPDSKVVEYYDDGTEEYTGIDWSSLNLVYEKDAEGIWRLVAIVNDEWTV